GRRADPFAIDPVTRGLNLWGCFAAIHFAAPLGKASCFLERQSRVARKRFSFDPYPMEQMKLDLMRVLAKNSESTASFLKPDIGPQSSPNARAAIIRYAP